MYHKIRCYVLHMSTTRKKRFSKIFCLSVLHDQMWKVIVTAFGSPLHVLVAVACFGNPLHVLEVRYMF